MVRITCPKCRKPCNVRDELIGQKIRCPSCQAGLLIPKPQTTPQRTDAIREKPTVRSAPQTTARRRERPVDRPRQKRPTPQSGSRSMVGWFIGGGLLGAAVVGAAVYFIMAPSTPTSDDNQQVQNQLPAENKQQSADPIDPGQFPKPTPQKKVVEKRVKPVVELPPIEQPPIVKAPDPVKPPVVSPKPKPTPVEPTPEPKPTPVKPAPQPLPDRIAADTVRAVKQATVYLRVATTTGQMSEGSGFLALEPGIVITNAHVLGMLNKNSRPPSKVDVVVHSGEPNELRLPGRILGVDRDSDLAVIRVEGKLPPPLAVDVGNDLVETQQVFIFGFPYGAQLGKNITVSKSSISSLRKDKTGTLKKIQVNGGMHPGNSGGPVVDSAGKVVGVSVAGIPGTQINFAIPGQFVRLLLAGRLLDSHYGPPFTVAGAVQIPVKYTCLDPFGRIRQMSVEVWAGKRGSARPFSLKPPAPIPGDGPRQTHAVKYADGAGTMNVVLPKLGADQVAWIQPVLVNSNGVKQWGPASPIDASLAIVRQPVNLVADVKSHKERTVHLKSRSSFSLIKGDKKFVMADNAELDALELFGPTTPQGMLVKIGFGPPILTTEENGEKINADSQVRSLLSRIPPVFIVDDANKLQVRSDINLNPRLPLTLREQVDAFYSEVCNAFEACNLIYPNRMMQPGENWQAKLPMLLIPSKGGRKAVVADLLLTCVYEGARTRMGEQEALVSITGRVQGRADYRSRVDGRVRGEFGFNVKGGYIAQADMTITTESDLGDSIQMIGEFDVNLKRRLGNPLNLTVPERKSSAPTPAPTGTIISQLKGALDVNDPLDVKFGPKGSRMKVYPLTMSAGKRYAIDVTSSAFDTFIRLITPDGRRVIAEDDDGAGNLNSRIIFAPNVSATFRLMVTSFNGRNGAFQITVRQLKSGQGGNRAPDAQR